MQWLWPLIVVLAGLIDAIHGDYAVDDAQLFKINFNSFASPNEESTAPNSGSGDPGSDSAGPLETLIMRSQWQEEYECQIPRTRANPSSKFQDPSAEGANALELLQELFLQKTCAYRLEHYWTYELCHGRHVRQFHEERDGKNVKVFIYFR